MLADNEMRIEEYTEKEKQMIAEWKKKNGIKKIPHLRDDQLCFPTRYRFKKKD